MVWLSLVVGLGCGLFSMPWTLVGKALKGFFFPYPAHSWQIQVSSQSPDDVLPEDDRKEIITMVSQKITQASPFELREAAEAILKDSSYDEVSIVKPALSTIYVHVKKRRPLLVVQADKLRLLSSQGTVYGLQQQAGAIADLPMLEGLFSDRKEPFVFANNNSLVLAGEEKVIIAEALDLLAQLQREHLNLKTLSFKKYRGFFAALSDPETFITFGRAPFTDKMKRLKKVLEQLTSKGAYAARIELDYEGKVFIKEKSL